MHNTTGESLNIFLICIFKPDISKKKRRNKSA